MSNFRKLNDDILREWLNYREETELGYLTKEDRKKCDIEYVKVLGFDNIGQHYLKNIKSDILISSKIPDTCLTRKYELISSKIYDLICETNTYKFELSNKPIKKIL